MRACFQKNRFVIGIAEIAEKAHTMGRTPRESSVYTTTRFHIDIFMT
jgi:hypothetical protein